MVKAEQQQTSAEKLRKEIKRAKEKHNLSRRKLAEITGVGEISLQKLEEGTTKTPAKDTTKKILDAIKRLEKKEEVKPIEKTIKSAIPEKFTSKDVKVQPVKALVGCITYYEVTLDVEETVVSVNPLKSERVYSNLRDLKLVSTSISEGEYQIVKIISEHINQEIMPSYAK